MTSIALAWVAMTPVLRTATADEGNLMSLDQLRDTGEVVPTPVPSPVTPSEAEAEAPAAEKTEPSRKSRTPSSSKTPSRTQTTTTPPAETTTPPPAAKKPATTIEDGWTVTTGGDGARTYVRSFQVEGGRTVIRAKDGVIELVTATPTGGFSVATVQNTPDNLAVYFNETNHSFIVHVVWQAGKPFAQVNEVGA